MAHFDLSPSEPNLAREKQQENTLLYQLSYLDVRAPSILSYRRHMRPPRPYLQFFMLIAVAMETRTRTTSIYLGVRTHHAMHLQTKFEMEEAIYIYGICVLFLLSTKRPFEKE